MTGAIFWAVVFIILVVIEAITTQLISIWFALASLVSLILSFFFEPTVQWIAFIVVSIVTLIATKPVANKILSKPLQHTNYELNVGKNAIVIETIDNTTNTGRVTLNGVDWTAVSEDGSIIDQRSEVVVKRVSGSKLIVSKV